MSAFVDDVTYEPPRLSRAEAMAMHKRRLQGLYDTKETANEALVCVRNLLENKTDKVFTLMMAHGVFNVYNMKEFMEQLSLWRDQGCSLLRTNIKEHNCGKYGKATFFTIQPPNLQRSDCPFSPLSLAFGTLVSGYTYVTLDPQLAELVWRVLGSKE